MTASAKVGLTIKFTIELTNRGWVAEQLACSPNSKKVLGSTPGLDFSVRTLQVVVGVVFFFIHSKQEMHE